MSGRRQLPEGITWDDEGLSEMEWQDDQEILEAVGTHACAGCGDPVVAIYTYCYGCLKQKEEQAKANQAARRGQRMQKWLYDQFNRGY